MDKIDELQSEIKEEDEAAFIPTCINSQELIFRPSCANQKPKLTIKCSHCKKYMETIIDDTCVLVENDPILTTCVADLAKKWHQIHPESDDYYELHRFGWMNNRVNL